MNFLNIAATVVAVLGAQPMELPRAAMPTAAATIRIDHDTPVELMALSEVSTADAKPGTIFKLRVNRAIQVDGRTIIPVGAPAFGQVIEAVDSGGLGKSGRMTAKLLGIRLGDAEIPLDGETSAKGTGAGSAGMAVLFTGVVGLFHRGNNAKIKAGEILTGFVSEDVVLDLSQPSPKRIPFAPGPAFTPISTGSTPPAPVPATVPQP